ncbi:small integral membrane protein 24 [Phodopus roborovskii]|uniref:Smim24 protein n=1 Tax=Phodopus roborovskii TaxID=109678 RepID=A0AAU9YVH1_PHORO|nr:small integral membrane protein 24 [Phodopus roborovskii]CAH6779221.1 Smim24 [Phodopus roborovskii]
MDTLGRLLLAALLLVPAEAQQASERRLKPWLVGLAAVVGFLFIVFVLMLANRVWCSKPRSDDEEVTVRMEASMNEYMEPSKTEKKKQKKQMNRKGGHSNEGLELDEKDSSDDERDKKTAL